MLPLISQDPKLTLLQVIITVVASSLRNPLSIPGANAVTLQCWSGSFLQDDDSSSFDWLGEIKCVPSSFSLSYRADLAPPCSWILKVICT